MRKRRRTDSVNLSGSKRLEGANRGSSVEEHRQHPYGIRRYIMGMIPLWVNWAMWVAVCVLRCFTIPIFRFRALWPSKKMPPINNKLLLQSATSLAHMIRTRQVMSEEVMQAYVARIKAVNPLLNAVVEERFEEALNEARAVDQMLRVSVKGADVLATEAPFLGVPFTVKGSICVKGLSSACGRVKKLGERATEDAETVRLMRAAGAIPLLLSNCPELCMHYESYNKVTGTTSNPYDTRRTSSGSSGGEAALLGAAASVIGLGSDIAGSSRIPAMFTCVFGHKPTAGLVSYSGHIPTATDKNWSRYFTVAPMTRYAEDLAPLLKVMTDENANKLRLDEKVNIRDLKVFYMEEDGSITTSRVHPEIRSGMHRVIAHLNSAYNIEAQKVDIKDFKYMLDIVLPTIIRLEGVNSVFQKGSDPTEWNSVCMELIKFFMCMSTSNLPPILYGVLKKSFDKLPDHRMKWINSKISGLQKQFKEMLEDDAVFLFPTFTRPAFFHGEGYLWIFDCMTCSIFNVLELPATNCPLGLTRDGLPIGMQIVAGPYQDRLSLALAREVEAVFGGWVPPPCTENEAM